jgi:hypothetical protein
MRLVRALACAMIASMVGACSMGSQTAPSGQNNVISKPTATQRAELEAANARFKQALASGYRFEVTGSAATATVNPNGSVNFDLGRGDRLTANLVKMPSNTYRVHLSQGKTPSFFQNGCGDGCGGGGGGLPTPDPYPTEPPNSGDCAAAGGVAWGSGRNLGCLGPGDAIPFCGGSWWWLGAGRGRFWGPNNETWTGSWAAENDIGCTFGG